MLSRYLEMLEKDPNIPDSLNCTKKLGKLAAFELNALKEIVATLKPFEQASDDFQGVFETVGNVIPAYMGLTNLLSLSVVDRHGARVPNMTSTLSAVRYCKDFVESLKKSLTRRFHFCVFEACYVIGKLKWISIFYSYF